MARMRPGDVLAGRYRLDDLLSESGRGRFWRGYDLVLSRPVAVHVIDAEDERATRLMEAARSSARVVEPRLLRVLDVENDGSICYVVNEWGRGTSLDHLVAAEGPLPPRRAAWIADEVATALDNAHARGTAHGRLNPENVLIDASGSIRIIGFAVDAALHGLDADRVGIDVVDLAGLLHFGLTGTWPGLSESTVPRTPREQHGPEYRVLRPRQVRAGVPRVLDDLADQVLNRPHGRHAGPHTAHEVHEVLAAYVGDRAGLSDELADRPAPTVVGKRPDPAPAAPVEPEATVAGLPSFDATDAGAATADRSGQDAAWFAPREDVPEPPPPLEPPPERPLFAPEPTDGRPRRTARASVAAAPPVEPPSDSAAFWPFDATPDEPPVPGRRWLRLGLALAALVLLVVAGVVVAAQLRDDDPQVRPDGGPSPTASPTPTPVARPITGTSADDFDPLGTPPAENSDLAGLVVDGDRSTSWRTSTYRQDLGPGGIKSGVGLVIDLKAAHRVSRVDLDLARPGASVSLFVAEAAPRSVEDLGTAVATVDAGARAQVRVDPPAPGRFVTVWLTSLPPVTGGYRAEVDEVSVLGTPV